MALLNSILQHKPSEWDVDSYTNKRFVRITLDDCSTEYNEIKSEFIQKYGARKILKIERVQHAFAFARFKINREHIAIKQGCTPTETRKYFPINDADKIDTILEFNCDQRRGGSYFNDYMSCSLSSQGGYVLVAKTLADFGFDQRDTHRYPEYIIQYGNGTETNHTSTELDDLRARLFRL